jgi:hypothetical protein
MRSSLIGLTVVLLIGAVVFSCNRVKPEPPPHTTLDSSLAIPVSTLTIPIHYDIKRLEKMVNSKVKGVFLREKFKVNQKGDSLYIEIEKRGDIQLSWNNPTLSYSFPVKVSGNYIKRVGIKRVGRFKVTNHEPVEMEMVLHLATRLGFGTNWELTPKSRLDEIKWIRDPKLKIAMIKVNLRKTVEGAIDKNEDKLTAKLDEALSMLLDTRQVIDKLWHDIQKPIRINKKEKQVWLKAYGTDIQARLVDAGPDQIAINVQLKSRIETIIEGEALPDGNDTLPISRADATSDDDSLQIYVKVKMPYKQVRELLNKTLSGKKLEAEGYSTAIKDIDLYGTTGALALKIKLRGDVDGQIYVTAAPAYDTGKAVLSVQNFSYDIDTENALVSSANWLLHDNVLDLVKNQLSLEVQPYFDSLPRLITRGIERGKVGEKIDVTIASLHVKPISYLITKNDLQIIFLATGHASIELEQKVFAGKGKKHKKRLHLTQPTVNQ